MTKSPAKVLDRRGRSDDDQLVATRIRLRRKVLNLSGAELAEKLGISWQQLQKYETAKNRVSAGRLRDLSRLLNVPIDFFFTPLAQSNSDDLLRTTAGPSPAGLFGEVVAHRPMASAQECAELLALYLKCDRRRQELAMEMLRVFAN